VVEGAFVLVLFLDFDGVMNGGSHPDHGFDWCLTSAVENLNRLLSVTKAKVVVSSAWRLEMDLQGLRKVLDTWGVEADVIGMTPVLNFVDPEWDPDAQLPEARIVEIRAWLDAHPNEVLDFAVLDDNDIRLDMNDDMKDDAAIWERFVQTRTTLGLTQEEVQEVLALWGFKLRSSA
jgi:hypothetical protein